MKAQDRHEFSPSRAPSGGRYVTAAVAICLGLAASGCAQSMSEFARASDPPSTTAKAYGQPVALSPSDQLPPGTGVVRPAVMVDETTVATPTSRAPAPRPMSIAPQSAQAEQPAAIAPAAVNLNQVPDQPKGKLLTPDEKAKVIAELEALAKSQSASPGKKKTANCAKDTLKPQQLVVSANDDKGC